MTITRDADECLCCGNTDVAAEPTIVSPYFAMKALGTGPQPCQMIQCNSCDFRYYDRGISDAEGDAYYRGYRDEAYFRERNGYEPFYTRAAHDGLAEHIGSQARRESLATALAQSGAGARFDCVVDYGGGDGGLVTDLHAARRISFDPSGTPGQPGVEVIEDRDALPATVDLVTCAHVLEHVSDPNALVDDMLSILRPGGFLYLEVPDQIWKRLSNLSPSRGFVDWLARHPNALLAADVVSTAFRVKLGVLPPFGFVPMREHINFFSASALRGLVSQRPVRLCGEGRACDNSFWLVAQKQA